MTTQATEYMQVSMLTFDLKNPRLIEYELTPAATDVDVIKVLWEAMDIRELVLSICASGFFYHEPLIVSKENGRNIVIEGNRRLAAVKLLLDPTLVHELNLSVPTITDSEKKALRELPAIVDTRDNAWRYLGFKHVNGPAKWSSFAKSQYIADVHRTYGVSLQDIASQIGDTHRTVQRLFRGLMVIEQAERRKVFDRRDRQGRHFSFSHLYTGLDYEGISSFIGLQAEGEEAENPVPDDYVGQLGELCLWMYGSKKEGIRPVIQSQNPDLRHLDSVLANREAVAALRAGIGLNRAQELTRSPSTVFEESLHTAKRSLERARGLSSIGYDGSKQLLTIADDVVELAFDLYEEMYNKSGGRRERRDTRRG